MTVMSLRLNKEEAGRISKLSKLKKEEKSTAARELLNAGWTLYWVKLYRSGKASIGKLAEELGFSMSEAIDLLSDFGIESPLRYDDYLQGFQSLNVKK